MNPPAAQRSRELALAIHYVTRYDYDADVVDNLNALRVRPATDARQRVEDFSIRVSPEVRLNRHDDYFGTEVVEFEVSRPHRRLVIDVRARVAIGRPESRPAGSSWASLVTDEYREAGGEFLLQTEDAPENPVLGELQSLSRECEDPLATLLYVSELIPDRFEYRRGATYVDSPLSHVLDGGAGVCQDFVHLGLNLLRRHGIAARYVSGYLFSAGRPGADRPRVRDGAEAESVQVDTHAWIEGLVPDADREPIWVGVDPTNRGLTGQRHVKIGHGRHYADVPPIKGVYRGMANSTLEASVTMTRLDLDGGHGAS